MVTLELFFESCVNMLFSSLNYVGRARKTGAKFLQPNTKFVFELSKAEANEMGEVFISTGILSQIRTALRNLAFWQARASCFSRAALSFPDWKTVYSHVCPQPFHFRTLGSLPNRLTVKQLR